MKQPHQHKEFILRTKYYKDGTMKTTEAYCPDCGEFMPELVRIVNDREAVFNDLILKPEDK